MAVSWPFDSIVSGDSQGNPVYSRAYSSDVIAKILSRYFSNGVFGADSTCFQVVAAEGMTVAVRPGFANINGRQVYEEADRVLAVQAADTALDRIDSVVLRLNLAVSALSIDLYIVKGVAAAAPVAPALTRNASVWELGLANLFIAKNTTAIPQGRITDTRLDDARCGVVASVIGDTDTGAYYAQINADLAAFKAERQAGFDAWFDTVVSTLGTNEAGNLLNQINGLRTELSGRMDGLEAGKLSRDVLLYTNPNPTQQLSSAMIELCANTPAAYRAIRIDARYLTVNSLLKQFVIPLGETGMMDFTVGIYNRYRTAEFMTTGFLALSNGTLTTLNNSAESDSPISVIPVRVWGVPAYAE